MVDKKIVPGQHIIKYMLCCILSFFNAMSVAASNGDIIPLAHIQEDSSSMYAPTASNITCGYCDDCSTSSTTYECTEYNYKDYITTTTDVTTVGSTVKVVDFH